VIKQRTIEALDAALGDLPIDRAIVCVTGDHATPTYPDVIHSGDPVPFVLNGPGVRADSADAFGELNCAAGILGHLRGPDMMPVLLNAADRPLFLGSRPTPFAGADGYPELLEPLL
jgi:2,3-bisphosphoglycerate-independent phosphoglycerate mutase